MIARLIAWSLRNRIVVIVMALALAVWGAWSAYQVPLDAIPDLSDVQVIVKTSYPGQSPQLVEDQVTYPLSTALMAVPRSTAVRGFSMYGESFVYVIFEDGTDSYWARTRVLEALSQLGSRLPVGVTPTLGPDASGVGWVFEYALVDKQRAHDPDELRALQDFFIKYELQAVPGVAEVASIGGAVRQFQIEIDPNRLAASNLTLDDVRLAVQQSNLAAGGAVVEMGRSEFMVRMRAYLETLDDFRRIPVAVGKDGVALRLGDVAHVQIGPELRRGAADLDGQGEVTGGIVVLRYGAHAAQTIARVKQRIAELQKSLPNGVELVVTYDRSGLISRAVATLREKLIEESLVVALVCLAFLFHIRSSLVAVVTLPLGILAAFVVMHAQGISANIMSLGGIAIAIGTMVDAAVVMIENMHKQLERGSELPRWQIVEQAAVQVGPALFFSLLVIAVSFFPVFALTGQEGRLFAPLAYTKTYAMAAAALLSVTLVPVLMGYFIRGRIVGEQSNPINRLFYAAYRPVLSWALQRRVAVIVAGGVLVAACLWPASRLGTEFMPPLDEGDVLYMPTTLPGVSLDEAATILQTTDRLLRQLPEVERVFGKVGRADTATDPAPLSMIETTIMLKPRSAWPPGETMEELLEKFDRTVKLPGLTNSWGYPVRTRIDMLATGVRSILGIKIAGPDLSGIAQAGAQIEAAIKSLPGTRSVFAERATGGHYLDVRFDRERALRYGVRAADLQPLIANAIGGEQIGTVVVGRERYSINLRYPRALRDSVEALRAARIKTGTGAYVALGQVAEVVVVDEPVEIKSENGRLIGYVYVDVDTRDIGGYVAAAQHVLSSHVALEPGYTMSWSGQYANLQRAQARLTWLLPVTAALVVLLLTLHFRNVVKVALVLLGLPLALSGGVWLVWLLDYQLSVAVAIGFIALAGVAAEFGVVMLLYLDQAVAQHATAGQSLNAQQLREAVVEGALLRIRPKMMTVSVIVAGLIPLMLSDATGADVMKRIAAPLVGGMITAPLLSLIVLPVLYLAWQERRGSAGGASA